MSSRKMQNEVKVSQEGSRRAAEKSRMKKKLAKKEQDERPKKVE